MRSSRPMRCSTTAGFQGRSKSTSRRQNSKFRPSPPASVETRMEGPSGRRNWATSMSRRSVVRSSWKMPTRRPCRSMAVFKRSRLSRWATKTRFSPPDRSSGPPARRASAPAGPPARPRPRARRFRRRPGPERGEGGGGGQGAEDPVRLAPAGGGSLGRPGAEMADEAVHRLPAVIFDRSTGAGHPRRQAADVHPAGGAGAGGQGLAPGEALFEAFLFGKLLGAEELEEAEEAVGVVLQRRGGEQQDVPAQGCDGGHGPVLLVAGVPLGTLQVVGLVHDQEVDPRLHGLLGEPPAGGEELQGDDGPAVDVEGVEVPRRSLSPRPPGASRRAERRPGGTSATARRATGGRGSRAPPRGCARRGGCGAGG
jgi:hypothetical protein